MSGSQSVWRETEREGGAVGVDDFLVLAPTGEGQVFLLFSMWVPREDGKPNFFSPCSCAAHVPDITATPPPTGAVCFISGVGTVYVPKILPKFLDSSSHRIFEHMHETLNIDKK
jgi:hypothetical protein